MHDTLQYGIQATTTWWKLLPPSPEKKRVLNMKEEGSSKMFAPTYQTTQHYIPQDNNTHIKCVTIYCYMPTALSGMMLGHGADLP